MATANYFNPYAPYGQKTAMCDYCGVRPKHGNHPYCGKTCANQSAQGKPYTTINQPTTQWPSTNPGQDQSQGVSNATSDSKVPTDPSLCENCGKRWKGIELKDDGEMVTHRFCGILCYEASRTAAVPSSMIPAPAPAPAAASSRADAIGLREEGSNAPIGRKVLLMMQERWESDSVSMSKLKSIYRIDLPGSVYRRFDFALQANDGCTVVTTYFGGKTACDIANDSEPAPCNLESCAVCDAIRTAFSQLIYGASSTHGKHGPGIYTYTNPALAHQAAVLGGGQTRKPATLGPPARKRLDANFVLLQCRVVTRGDSTQVANPYAGFVDDSGTVFCGQSMAIIPTHLLVYGIRVTTRDTAAASITAIRAVPRTTAALTPIRPRRAAVKPPSPPPTTHRSLPNAPIGSPVLLGPAPPVARGLGVGLKPLQLSTNPVVPPIRRRRFGVSSPDELYAPLPETDSGPKNNWIMTADHSRATTLAAPIVSADTLTIEAPRKPLVLASPKPIRPVVALDPAYIALPPSPSPPAPDPPAKKTAEKAANPDAKPPVARADQTVRPYTFDDEDDEIPSTPNTQPQSATPPKPFRSLFSVPSHASMDSLYGFTDKRVPHFLPAPKKPMRNEVSSQDVPSPQPVRQTTPDRPGLPSPLCRNCLVQNKFPGFDYCSKACASEADKKKGPPPVASVPKSPATFADPWDDETVRAPAFSPYSARRESTPPLVSYAAIATAVVGEQPTAEPAGPVGTQSRETPNSDQDQAFAPLSIDSDALGDFAMPPRLYQQMNDSSSSERGGQPRIGAYTGQRATFGPPPANEQPVASGNQAPGTPIASPVRLGEQRPNGSTSYLPYASTFPPAPVVEAAAPITDDGLIVTAPTTALPFRETRTERGKVGDRISLIKKWANLGSDLRKGKNKD